MKSLTIPVFLLVFVFCGCTQELDRELMNARQQIVSNESLYAAAELAFAKGAEEVGEKLAIYQNKSLQADTDNWVRRHTNSEGIVTATPEEMSKMFAERDAKAAVQHEAQVVWKKTVENFRQMVADKQRLVAVMFAKEQEAQEAKDASVKALESLKNTLLGAASSAAIALPIVIP